MDRAEFAHSESPFEANHNTGIMIIHTHTHTRHTHDTRHARSPCDCAKIPDHIISVINRPHLHTIKHALLARAAELSRTRDRSAVRHICGCVVYAA